MTTNIKLTILTIIGLAGIIVFTMTQNPTDCWDKYSNNEVQAILNCEGKE